MADKITTFPIIQEVDITGDPTFGPQGVSGFSNRFQGDVYTSRGRFGNGTNYIDISATQMKSANFVSGSTGWQIKYDGDVEFNEGVFRGDVSVGSLHIPDEITANSFHTNTTGDSWWGCIETDFDSDNDNANAYILNTGNSKFQNITLEGTVILKDLAAGSVVDGQYVNALSVGKLSAGTITSKAITLAVAAGTGDSYIAGGTVNVANWTADKGFILGIDDSDSDLAKFFVGDHANFKYMKFDGVNLTTTGLVLKNKFIAGESITAGDVVCIKKRTLDYQGSTGFDDDSYTYSVNPDTNYGTSTTLNIGFSGQYHCFFKPKDLGGPVEKAVIRIWGNVSGTVPYNVYAQRVSSADWAEDTITHNNKPDSTTNEGLPRIAVTTTGFQWIEIDITQWYRKIEDGTEANDYGLQILTDGGNSGDGVANIRSKEYTADTSQQPILRITFNDLYELTGGKLNVYKADESYILTSLFVKGIAIESKTVGNDIEIQTAGLVTTSGLNAGAEYFVGSSGSLTTKARANINTIYSKVGDANSITELFLNIEPDKWLETIGTSGYPVYILNEKTILYVACHPDTNMAVIEYKKVGNNPLGGTIVLMRNGPTLVTAGGKDGGVATIKITFEWETTGNVNRIKITNTDMGSSIGYDTWVIVAFYK